MKQVTKRNPSKYGWKKQLPDQRDLLFADRFALKSVLPSAWDLTERYATPAIYDQGQVGSCTGNAGAFGFEFEQLKDLTKVSNFVFVKKAYTAVSRLFIYFNERVIEGTTDSDAGATLRDCIKSMAKYGACTEKTWKYVEAKVTTKPTKASYTEGAKHKIKEYVAIKSPQEIKQSIVAGHPVLFGFSVYESFESDKVARTGKVPMPKKSESLLGGHAVAIVGYDDVKRLYKCRNSWGPDWGDHGYFYLPYAYVQNPNLADDFWAITA